MLRLAIFLISCGALGLEILLMRLFSIVQWHHFASMIISTALLGYGASGTLLVLARRWFLAHADRLFPILAALFGLTAMGSFLIAERVPFNALEIMWDAKQLLWLLAMACLLFLPFLCAATFIGLALQRFSSSIHRIYAVDLAGAGMGSLGMVAMIFFLHPITCLGVIGGIGFFAAVCAADDVFLGKHRRLALALACGGCLVPALIMVPFGGLTPSPYKGLAKALLIPGTEVIEERSSPFGLVSLVRSSLIPFRHAPGISMLTDAEIPEQLGVFTDGDGLTAITRADDQASLRFLQQMTQALPYELLEQPSVLVLGVGGGMDLLMALEHGAQRVVGVELNPDMLEMLKQGSASLGDDPLKREEVKLAVGDARSFIRQSREGYDLIQISLMDAYLASVAGISSIHESFLYTAQSLKECFAHLNSGGIIAITRWIAIPPRESLKLFGTALAMLADQGIADPEAHLALIRSWNTSTLLIARDPLDAAASRAIRNFCERNAFDLVFLPGMQPHEGNRFNLLEEPYFAESAQALIGPESAAFLKSYKYDIRPTTDDRPYFFNFFKWSALPELWKLRTRGGAGLMEWGYPLLIATLLQSVAMSLLLVLLPLHWLRREGGVSPSLLPIFFSFAALGLAFLFIEIAFMRRLMLFLGEPLLAIAVVMTAFLIFAGLGSFASQRLVRRIGGEMVTARSRGIAVAIIALVFLALLVWFAIMPLMEAWMGLPQTVRIIVVIAAVAPIAFCMGIPFPLGLAQIGEAYPASVPWAWGINGCASVISPIMATLLAIHVGFTAVIGMALFLYLVAAVLFQRRLSSP